MRQRMARGAITEAGGVGVPYVHFAAGFTRQEDDAIKTMDRGEGRTASA